jgi:hypothetical protein
MERNEGGEVVRRRIERKEGESPPSFLSIHPPHYLSPLSHPHYLSPLSHPHYLSPSFLSVILTTSPSFTLFNPPPHYLSSLSCNIIIHLITSVFLPSPSSLLTRG